MDVFLRIAIPNPLRKLFDYLPPIEGETTVFPVGARVLVPFRSQKKVGIIVEVGKTSDYPISKLKHIDSVLDKEALFPEKLFELIQWTSRYYHGSLGEVFEAALPSLLRKAKILSFLSETPGHFPLPHGERENGTGQLRKSLNPAQAKAVETISRNFGKFKTFLLNGVTGSGKTEVYLQIVEKIVAEGKQALILVPEIGLTPQLLERFEKRFSVPIALLNSSLSEKKRLRAWENARSGLAPIVIGTRLSTFVPLKNPGVFIIDEEHDPSFKQQDGLRYHARDLLIKRASLEHCPIILGSATPSLETLHNAETGKFIKLPLPSRAGSGTFPSVQILDIRHKKCVAGLSAQLIQTIREHLQNKGQVLLFLNRRGFAPVLMCFECGWVANCKNCDAKMTLHYKKQILQCHHCETTIPIYTECPACKKPDPKPIGVGTERLEATLQKYFPDNVILRIDRDTTRKKGAMKETMDKIHNGEADILLGTQMIAKGHHFPNVTLVGILDIDQALFSSDFRSLERMGQLIIQVAGRTGRADRLGHVILQTCHPEHPLLKTLLENGYLNLASHLLSERNKTKLPPFSYQALIRAEAKTLEMAINFLNFAKSESLKLKTALKVLGPIAAPMERRQGKHRAQLLIQTTDRLLLQKFLQTLIPIIENHSSKNTVRWSLDVDPIDMY